MLILAGVVFVAAGGMIVLLQVFAETIGLKTRIAYFKACLEKDAAFYDVNLPTSMASRISKESAAI